MSELLPCPFCGREPRVQEYANGRRAVACGNYECPCFMNGNSFETEAEAIAAWNTRAERTCKNEEGWCSECEHFLHDGFKWCPWCGAKVVK